MTAVSVILVGYNSRDLLERAIASVDVASAGGAELVLVDNGSTDGTVALVRERCPRCRVIEPGENLGFGRGCNLGARETDGELILLLNPDAWVDPVCVDRLRQAMAADDRLAWAAPRLHYPDGRRQFIWGPTIGIFGEAVQRLRNRFERQPWVHGLLPRVVRALGDPGWYSAACGLVRRRAWEEVGGFDPGFFLYFEDADLGLRLRQAGWRLAQIADARAFHDKHGPSASSDRLVHYRESQLRYYRKHRPRWENRVLLDKQTRGAARIDDAAIRSRLGAVYERARVALDAGVVDLPDNGARVERAAVAAPSMR
jgi:GT2 family glycosyltransferase